MKFTCTTIVRLAKLFLLLFGAFGGGRFATGGWFGRLLDTDGRLLGLTVAKATAVRRARSGPLTGRGGATTFPTDAAIFPALTAFPACFPTLPTLSAFTAFAAFLLTLHTLHPP